MSNSILIDSNAPYSVYEVRHNEGITEIWMAKEITSSFFPNTGKNVWIVRDFDKYEQYIETEYK